jgi:membrane protein implicated in regulation of membrane protease activity
MNMYVIFFGIGVGFVLISFLLGAVVDCDSGNGNGPLAIFQPKLIAAFLTVTGGAGIILSSWFDSLFSAPIVFAISVLSGLIIAGLLNRLVMIPLQRAQNTSAHDKQATIGTWAKVISPIPQGGYGKIRYSVSGSVVTSPAKSEDGGEIKNGENVAIVYIEGGTFFVRSEMQQEMN